MLPWYQIYIEKDNMNVECLIALAILLKIATHNIFPMFYCTGGWGAWSKQTNWGSSSQPTTRATHTRDLSSETRGRGGTNSTTATTVCLFVGASAETDWGEKSYKCCMYNG